MKIFISWSGERSKQVAELLKDWLQCVIQATDPWLSTEDIDPGTLWFSKINDALADVNTGIVCLTEENKNKPWVLFEAGALAKGLSSQKVCTLLIDLKPTDLQDPLAQFNHTQPTKEGLFKLISSLNKTLEKSALTDKTLNTIFEKFYPEFQKKFDAILSNTETKKPKKEIKEPQLLEEILSAVRNMEKQIRDIESKTVRTFPWEWENIQDYPPSIPKPKAILGKSSALIDRQIHRKIPNNPLFEDNKNSQ